MRTLVIATRELHGAAMDPEHVVLAWCVCVRFAAQIMSRTVKGADWLTAFQRAFQRASHPRAMIAALERQDLVLGSKQEEDSDRRQVLGTVSSWASKKALRSSLWEHLRVVWFAELSKDRLVKTLQIQSFSTASVEHPRDCCQMTSRERPEN